MGRWSIAPARPAPGRGGPAARASARALAPLVAALAATLGAASVAPRVAADTESGVLSLPALANTPDGDRELLREVDDAHVHEHVRGRAPKLAREARGRDAPDGRESRPAPLVATAASPVPVAPGTPTATPPAADALAPDALATSVPGSPSRVPGTSAGAPPTDDVWARIRASARLPVADNPAVAALREEYVDQALWVGRILERGTPWLGHLVDELDRRFLPLGLALLPAVESGFRPEVHSSGDAAGLWQIVPITADEIGLERSVWFDGRTDVIASTTAALDYLSYLNAEFHGDWELTLAAYNAGPGRVRAAVRKNLKAGEPTDFWSLPLPAETRRYVPKVLALVALLREDPSPIPVPDVTAAGFELVDVGLRISLDRAAALSGLDEAELKRLNAGLVHGVTAPRGPHALYVPAGAAGALLASVATADRDALYSLPLTHEVVAGDTLSGIAYRYGISQQQLMAMNGLSDTAVRAGQTLAVIDVRRAGAVEVEYTVGAGDTLSRIAETHAVGLEDISRTDGSALEDDVIRPGDTLSIAVGGSDDAS